MNDSLFQIGADGIDATKIVEDIRQTVQEKTNKGVYAEATVAKAERANLANLKDEDNFLDFYLDCLRDAVFVDISDFEIIERRSTGTKLLLILKKTIWKLLKFYTYRMWSQQNQVNGLLLSAIESSESKQRDKIQALENKIKELEARIASNGAS